MPTSPIPGWDDFLAAMRDLPEFVLGKLPERVRDDPQVRAEAGRRIMASLAYSAIDGLCSDGDYPIFHYGVGQLLNIGQPNADTGYRAARLTPGGSYRIRGKRGVLRELIATQNGPFPYEPGATARMIGGAILTHDLNALPVDGDGCFDVVLSPERPADYDGPWWKLEPGTVQLWLRMVKGDWASEEEPSLSIERIDIAPGGKPRATAAWLEQRLRTLGPAVRYYATVEIEHVERLRKGGFLNENLTYYDTAEVMGLEGQFYFECAYELADDEALLIEARIPRTFDYWSVMLTNEVFETTDWYNNHSSINDTQALVDGDGIARIVVSHRDPGVPNWLDTAGYPTGQFQGRWLRADAPELPRAKKIALGDVRAHLPADTPVITPEQREAVLRARRMHMQFRRLG